MRTPHPGQPASHAVSLHDLLQSRPLSDLQVRFQSEHSTRVQDLALITEVEEVMAVEPDTVVLLADEVSAGSWIVSAALHYAWERRACAVVAPAHAITSAAVEVSRRLDVTLISAERDVTRLGIEMAIQLGIARAGVIAHVQSFSERLSKEESITSMFRMISREFDGARVQVNVAGTVTIDVADEKPVGPGASAKAGSGSSRPSEEPVQTVSVRVRYDEEDTRLVVVGVDSYPRDYVEQMLRAAVPSLRALLFKTRLDSILQSLPTMSLASMVGTQELSVLDEPMKDQFAEALHSIGTRYRAVCMLVEHPQNLGAAVHQVWQHHFPEIPLASVADGWLAFIPMAQSESGAAIAETIRESYDAARMLGLSIGVSSLRGDRSGMAESVREAWIAARLAVPGGERGSNVVEFDRVETRLLERLLPPGLARRLAKMLVPELLQDPQADEIIAAVVAFLSSRGSISRAAEMLGVHRNTVQMRVRRAEELGLPLSDPDRVLSSFMILSVLQGEIEAKRAD